MLYHTHNEIYYDSTDNLIYKNSNHLIIYNHADIQ